MNKLVSIVVPVYNESEFLDSFFSMIDLQTYTNVELVMVDDGSTDDSWNRLKNQSKLQSNLQIIHQDNNGVSVARNKGLAAANGRFIVFADADDSFEPEYIAELVRALVVYQTELVVCGYTEFNTTVGETFRHSDTINPQCDLNEAVLRIMKHHCMCSALWNKIFIANVIRDHGLKFDPQIAVGEDLLFIIEYISHIKSWCEISDVLYHYRISDGGTMQNYKSVNQFSPSWLSEWTALEKANLTLMHPTNDYQFDLKVLRDKRLRVAIKLLGRIRKFRFQTAYASVMRGYIRSQWMHIVVTKGLSFKQKIKAIVVIL